MTIAIVTGASGLIGSESVRFFAAHGFDVVGIDNDMRRQFFGEAASTAWNRDNLVRTVPGYSHVDADIRDEGAMEKLFKRYGNHIGAVVHCAGQPSHDWAAREPLTDFTINANGTLVLLEMTRRYCPGAVFIFSSTNKVYGDTPNTLPLAETETRWEISEDHPYFAHGIDEGMSIDASKHSLFGVSKASADLMVQEYGRYFGMMTACFRCSCLTGPAHSGAELHGFLAYLMRCAVEGTPYTIYGYKGKQVRDNLHSLDLINAFWHFFGDPKSGAVYNMGGGRQSNCSVLEAVEICQEMAGRPLSYTLSEESRSGDHIWWISDVRRFQADYPDWLLRYDQRQILQELHDALAERLKA